MPKVHPQRLEPAIPVEINLGLAAAFLAAGLALVLLLPLLVSARPAGGLLLVLFAAATPTLWALVHEAIHGSLHPARRWNELLGRGLAILFGAPLQVLRFGHLSHHRTYGMPQERPEAPRQIVPRILSIPFHYFRILGGVYLAEVATVLIAFLPRRRLSWVARQALLRHPAGSIDNRQRIARSLLSRESLARIRLDSLFILAIYGTGFALYGPHAWMLLLALAGRAAMVSFMDNIYHHRPPGVARRTLDLRLPAWASRTILHANLHAVHHLRPGLPWSALPSARRAYPALPEAGFVAISLEQLLKPAV